MGLSFLVPAFLIGIAVVAIPILVHLRQRERKEPIRFPSLMFLTRIPHRTVERRKITHPLLLLLRALAVAVLVLAFARPFLDRDDARPLVGRIKRAVIVLLDRSMSMGYAGVWPRARDSVLAALTGLEPGDRAALIAFDESAEVIAPLDEDLGAVRSRLEGIAPTGRTTRFPPALRLAAEVAANARGSAVEVVLVSDIQRHALTGLETVDRIPDAVLRVSSVAPEGPVNSRVANVDVDRRVESGRVRLAVSARLATKGGGARNARVALTVNHRELATVTARLAPNAVTTVRFEPVWIADGDAIAQVSLEPDPLPADDTLRFTLGGPSGVRVALQLPPGAAAGESVYLERALALSRAPALLVDTRRGPVLPQPDLDRAAAVVVSDLGALGSGAALPLLSFVERGGGLILFAGPRAGARRDRPGWWPAGVGRLVERMADRGGTLGWLNRDHPALEPFREGLASDFGSARFFRYYDLTADSTAETVARFDDGRPALVERAVGRGRVLMIAAPADGIWTDLPLQPVFLPLLHRLVTYAGRVVDPKRYYTVGEIATLPAEPSRLTVRAPGGDVRRVEGDSASRAVVLAEPGFYQVSAAGAATQPIAANPPAEESDLASAAPAEVGILLRPKQDSAAGADPLTRPSAAEQEQSQSWWILLLALVAALLAGEAVYAGRLSRGVRVSGGAR